MRVAPPVVIDSSQKGILEAVGEVALSPCTSG
jgi:hypothetical protein